jgi:hypothetical protein
MFHVYLTEKVEDCKRKPSTEIVIANVKDMVVFIKVRFVATNDPKLSPAEDLSDKAEPRFMKTTFWNVIAL